MSDMLPPPPQKKKWDKICVCAASGLVSNATPSCSQLRVFYVAELVAICCCLPQNEVEDVAFLGGYHQPTIACLGQVDRVPSPKSFGLTKSQNVRPSQAGVVASVKAARQWSWWSCHLSCFAVWKNVCLKDLGSKWSNACASLQRSSNPCA